MKKVLILTGSSGVGLSKISFNSAKLLSNNNKNTEIIMFDHIKLYKNINLIANKPPQEYTSQIKYHNLDTKEIFEAFKMNSAIMSTQTRNIINHLLMNNVNPLVQGGSFFYIKSLTSGGSNYLTDIEASDYKKARIIANSIIQFDGYNFDMTSSRLEKLDKSFKKEYVPKNDFYRLERRYADYIFYGQNAYLKNLEKDNLKRSHNQLDNVNMYKIFLYKDKDILMKNIEEKCVKLLENGLLEEVIYLIHHKQITPNEFYSLQNPLKNSYGISEAIDLLINLNNLNPKDKCLASLDRKDKIHYNQRIEKEIIKIFSEFITSFVIGTYQYSNKQLSLFYKDTECYLLKLQDNFDITSVTESIQKIYEMSKDEFISNNKLQKEAYKILSAPNYNPKRFYTLASNMNMHFILRNVLEEIDKIKSDLYQFEATKKGNIESNKPLSRNEILNYL